MKKKMILFTLMLIGLGVSPNSQAATCVCRTSYGIDDTFNLIGHNPSEAGFLLGVNTHNYSSLKTIKGWIQRKNCVCAPGRHNTAESVRRHKTFQG